MKRRIHDFDPFYFHIVGKCSEKKWPAKNLSNAWELFSKTLHKFSCQHSIHIHAFVLMINHYHLLCSSQTIDVDFEWLHKTLNFNFTQTLQTQEIINNRFARPVLEPHIEIVYLDHIISLRNAYRYIYRNPVAAGIVEKAEYYPYSTLPHVLGRSQEALLFNCIDVMNLIYDPLAVLNYINTNESKVSYLWKQ